MVSNAQVFPEPTGNSGDMDNKKKKIEKCEDHASTGARVLKFNTSNRRYSFEIAFWPDCYQTTGAKKNELWQTGCDFSDCNPGWNKAGRIAFWRHHTPEINKLHLGWKAHDQISDYLKLSAYFHEKHPDNWGHYFVSHYMFNVPTDHWIDVDMFLGLEVIGLIIENKALGMRKPGWIPEPKKSYLARTFYFGEKDKSKNCFSFKDMWIQFNSQEYDHSDYLSAFNSCDTMIWNITEFASDDDEDFYAYDEIWGSIPTKFDHYVQYPSDAPSQVKVQQKCVVKSGAEITFTAGKKVILYPGFHAKPGSHFIAKIEEKVKSASLAEKHKLKKAYLPPVESFDTIPSDCGENNNPFKNSFESNETESKITGNKYFNIYPNPSPGLFTLHFDDGKNTAFAVEIMDMMGNVVYKREYVQAGNTAIDIRERPKGIYFVKVLAGGKVYTEKVVVK